MMRRQQISFIAVAPSLFHSTRTLGHGGVNSTHDNKQLGGARELFSRELSTPTSRSSFSPYFLENSSSSSQYTSPSASKAKAGRRVSNESAAQIFSSSADFVKKKNSQSFSPRATMQSVDTNRGSRTGLGAPALHSTTHPADSAYMRVIRDYYGYLNAFRSAKYAEVNRLEEKVSKLNVAAGQERERFGREYLTTFIPLLFILFAFMEEQSLRTCAQHALEVLEDHRDLNSALPHVKI